MKPELEKEFTLEEFCEICHVSPDFIAEVIAFGIIDDETHLRMEHLKKIRKILRLQHDFETNLAGAALAIELMHRIDEMHHHIEWLEKHWRKI